MPGIVGLVTRMPRQRAEAELRQMLGVMRYQPYFTARSWVDEDLGLYVGWTARRGAFDDADAHQNETRDLVLIFSGEEYPPADERSRLKQAGHQIDADESAYLVHRCEEDAAFPASLNGLFHGVVVDRRRRTVSLFNDRYGMHRLYWHQSKDAFYFAAEAKALVAVRPELRKIDQRGLTESITLGCVIENRTIFEGVHLVPGGSAWTFENGFGPKKTSYFQPGEWENQELLDAESYYRELRRAFSTNVARYFAGSERVGISLTGGLDSRMILAWHQCPPGSVPCYTWGSPLRDCQDVIVGRKVAQAWGQPHQVIPMGKALLDRFAYFADRAVFITDGCVDAGLAPDVYMNEQAREIAPVRLTGLYGGEILRHVVAFKHVYPMAGLFTPELQPGFDLARKTYVEALQTHPVSFAAFRQTPWHHHSSLSLEQGHVTMRSPFLDNDVVKAVFRAPEIARTTSDASIRLIAEGNPALGRIPTDHGLTGSNTLAERIAHAWQKFTFRAEYAFDRGTPQWLAQADYLVRPLRLERLFLGLHKPLHMRSWYRDELAGYVRETLLDSKSLSRPYVERKTVERIVHDHIRGNRNYTTEIHKLLKLELLHRHFVDGQALASSVTESVAIAG